MSAHPEMQLPPLRGTMAGVKLSFLRTQFGSAGIRYLDDKDWWSSIRKSETVVPTQDTNIREFMITLNRRTFLPPCTKEDVHNYAGNFRVYGDANLPSASSRWLEFIFSPTLYSEGNGQLRHLYEEQVAASSGLIGPFIRRPDAFGLHHISSDREGGIAFKSVARDVYDTWYFDDHWQTLIACMRQSGSPSPLKITCVHFFMVPELKAAANGRYFVMSDVADWKRIETEFRREALSAVVSQASP